MASENFERAKQDYYDRIGYGEKSSVKGTPIIFIIVGVIFLIIGIVGANSSNNFMKNAKPVEAIVYSERDTYSSSDEDEYKAYAEYTVDGVNYYEYLSGFSHTGASKSKEGEKTTIYYNPENPKEIGVPSSKILFYIFIFMGAIVTLAGIYAIFRKNNVDNSTAPEKVADFWEKVDETTGFFDKSAAVETTVLNLKNIVGIVICACVILFGLIIQISDLSFSSKSKEITGTISKIDSYIQAYSSICLKQEELNSIILHNRHFCFPCNFRLN